MVVYDQNGKLLEEYDLELGRLEEHSKTVVFHCYIDDDCDQVVGVTDHEGNYIPEYDDFIPGNMPLDTYLTDEWKYYVYIPYTKEELFERRVAAQMSVAMQLCVQQANLTDEQALQVEALYPEWAVDTKYVTGFRVRYDDILYKVLQDHTSQTTWTPDISPSLFAKIIIVDPNIIPEWEPPANEHPFMKGDKVAHNGKTWVSDIDNNIWEPGVYGWTEVI